MKKSSYSQWRKLKRRLGRWQKNVGAWLRTRWKASGRGEALFFARRLALILILIILKHLLLAAADRLRQPAHHTLHDPVASSATELEHVAFREIKLTREALAQQALRTEVTTANGGFLNA